MQDLLSFDVYLFGLINRGWTSPFLDSLTVFLTHIGYSIRYLFIAVPFLYWKGPPSLRKFMVLLIPAIILSDTIPTYVLKPLFERTRPFLVIPDVRVLVDTERVSLYSFPSNHASNIFCVASLLCWSFPNKIIIPASLLMACLTAFSRIYVGVHYPMDVAAGAVLGIAIASAFYWGNRWLEKRKQR